MIEMSNDRSLNVVATLAKRKIEFKPYGDLDNTQPIDAEQSMRYIIDKIGRERLWSQMFIYIDFPLSPKRIRDRTHWFFELLVFGGMEPVSSDD